MKKVVKLLLRSRMIFWISGLAFILFLGSWSLASSANAITDKRSGLDVYVYSRPSIDYEVLGSNAVVVWVDCNEIFNKSIRKAAALGADGVIIYPETAQYDAIKYK